MILRVPALSINNNEMRVTPYPQGEEFSVEKLQSWFMKFVKGELQVKSTGFGDVIDADIKYMLQSTKMVTRNEFSSEVYEEGTDTIVFVYTTAVEDET